MNGIIMSIDFLISRAKEIQTVIDAHALEIEKLDQEIVKHWDSPVHTAALRWGM
jgi:hypothetical protein